MTESKNQFKVILEVYEGRGFVDGVSEAKLQVQFGEKKVLSKTKATKAVKTTHPVWLDHFEFSITSKENLALVIQILESKTVLGTVTIPPEDIMKLNQSFKESWASIVPEKCMTISCTIKPQLHIRMKIATGAPNKKLKKMEGDVAPLKKPRDPRANEIVSYLRSDDMISLEDYVLFNPNASEVNTPHPKNGNTALHECCIENKEAALLLLLSLDKCDVNIMNANKNTPFHYFCQHWISPDVLRIFRLFIRKGANVNAVNSNGETPLFKAIFNQHLRFILIQALIDNNANVDIVNRRGEGVLHYAVRLGRSDIVDTLLRACPNFSIKGEDGHTAYELATKVYGTPEHKEIAEHLEKVTELSEWLKKHQLSAFRGLLLKNSMKGVEQLMLLTEPQLVEMGVNKADRTAILKACASLTGKPSTNEPLPKAHLHVAKERKKKLHSKNPSPSEKKDKMEKRASPIPKKHKDKKNSNDKKNKSKPPEPPELCLDLSTFDPPAPSTVCQVITPIQATTRKTPRMAPEGVIENKDLEYLNHIASGTSGDVYQGLYLGIEVLKNVQEEEQFKREYAMLRGIDSPSVVKIHGISSNSQKLCMVMEYCSKGTLYDLMKDKGTDFTWEGGIGMCLEVVEGLNILHNQSPQILHRDLKSLNLLITSDWHIKICDFGLSRHKTAANADTLKEVRGTFAYCDPTVFLGQSYAAASDVYSLGIIFWEIVNRLIKGIYEPPFGEYKTIKFDFQIIVQAATQQLRPTIPEQTPAEFKDLIKAITSAEQEDRPSLNDISIQLNNIFKVYNGNRERWNKLEMN